MPSDASGTGAAAPEDFPALMSLRLEFEHLKVLAIQGILSQERRGRRVYVKLRFRYQGRQVVRYIGCDARRIARVRCELTQLQHRHRQSRQWARLVHQANQMFRAHKAAVAPSLAQIGCYFHGHSLRKKRPIRPLPP